MTYKEQPKTGATWRPPALRKRKARPLCANGGVSNRAVWGDFRNGLDSENESGKAALEEGAFGNATSSGQRSGFTGSGHGAVID